MRVHNLGCAPFFYKKNKNNLFSYLFYNNDCYIFDLLKETNALLTTKSKEMNVNLNSLSPSAFKQSGRKYIQVWVIVDDENNVLEIADIEDNTSAVGIKYSVYLSKGQCKKLTETQGGAFTAKMINNSWLRISAH